MPVRWYLLPVRWYLGPVRSRGAGLDARGQRTSPATSVRTTSAPCSSSASRGSSRRGPRVASVAKPWTVDQHVIATVNDSSALRAPRLTRLVTAVSYTHLTLPTNREV